MTSPSHLNDAVRPLICPQIVHGRRRDVDVRDAVDMADDGTAHQRLYLFFVAAVSAAVTVGIGSAVTILLAR